ncbi:MAG TPA: methyltransferase, partial [Actinomycetes bacterium]
RVAANHADYVVCADGDDLVLDGLYRSLRQEGNRQILPAYLDLSDPSPGLGWRGRERAAFFDRARPDAVLALALLHHLAITGNVPLAELVDWLHAFGGRLVVEFVDPTDPMADRLLANKPPGMHGDYRREVFERLLEARFDVVDRQEFPSDTRTLYHATPRH